MRFSKQDRGFRGVSIKSGMERTFPFMRKCSLMEKPDGCLEKNVTARWRDREGKTEMPREASMDLWKPFSGFR